ncbi:MAG: phosphoribosylglycinamide formyltransferase [bacterium]
MSRPGTDTGADSRADAGAVIAADPSVFRLAVLASGRGSNLQAIIEQLHGRPAANPAVVAPAGGPLAAGEPPVARAVPLIEVALVVSDTPRAVALERACSAGIRTMAIPFDGYANREEHDLAMVDAIREAGADLVVLAGYMRLVSPAFVRAFPWRIVNLHPALLPAFPGTASIGDALSYGVKVTGVTIHFVDEDLDTGPVIVQEPVRVEEGDTEESLAGRIHTVEHRLLPAAIRLIAAGKVRHPLPGSRVVKVDWTPDSDETSPGSRTG